jgi:hypothetical protein
MRRQFLFSSFFVSFDGICSDQSKCTPHRPFIACFFVKTTIDRINQMTSFETVLSKTKQNKKQREGNNSSDRQQ